MNDVAKKRIILADDHPGFRDGVCRLLQDEGDIQVVGTAADGQEAVKLARELQPDVVVMDIAMPNLNGIEAAKRIREDSPDMGIIMISAYDYRLFMLASIEVGADSYLLKDTPVQGLANAVRMVHSGQAVFDRKAAADILRGLASGDGQSGSEFGLHRREIEVLRLVAKGSSNKDIARELVVSERTVQSHLVNIFRKLKVSTRTEAVLFAVKRGWVSISDLP